MSARIPLPRPFGPYLLTRGLSADALGQTFRAGTLGAPGLRPFLLVREFNGTAIDRMALILAMGTVVDLLDEVKGPTVAKGAVLGAVDDVPFAAVEYIRGRTLDVLFAARSSGTVLSAEHALLVVERVLAGLEASRALQKATGAPHGFLVPAFVSISNEGETRIFGGGLGSGLLPVLGSPRERQALGPYVAPEVAASGQPSAAGDVYSAAVLLLEALTGRVPPPGTALDAVTGAVLASDGTPAPEDLKRLLARGLAADRAGRETDVAAYRKQLGAVLYGGRYAPSTFNLAFFLQRNFEKAIQREERDIQAEEHFDPRQTAAPAPRKPAPPPAPTSAPAPPARPASRAAVRTIEEPGRRKGGLSGAPLWGVLAAAGAILVGGGLFVAKDVLRTPAALPTPAATPTAPPPAPVPTPAPVVVGKDDPLFQAEVQKRLQEEMKKREQKIKADEESAAKKRQADLDRSAEEARRTKDAEDTARTARERSDTEEATRLAQEAQDARRREDAARAARAAQSAPPVVKEGDIVDLSVVDTPPAARTMVKPEPTRLALQRHVSGTVLLRVLVDENGRAMTVEILRDTSPRVGLGESFQAAVKQWTWSPAVKDGKRVRTWIAVQIPFRGF